MSRRLPLSVRILLPVIRGPDADALRGDIEERYHRMVGRDPGLAVRTARRDALRSALGWWRPDVFAGRRRRTPEDIGESIGTEGRSLADRLGALRLVLRALARRPAFSGLVIGTLGFGIGATATIYSIVDAVIVRPLPYTDSERLAAVGMTFPGREWEEGAPGVQHLAGVALLNMDEWRVRARVVQDFAAFEVAGALLPDRGDGPELVPMARVTEGFFDLFGVTPHLGRTLLPDDHRGGTGPVALLSYRAWVDRFGADPAVIGKPLSTIGSNLTIIGVLPRGFRPPALGVLHIGDDGGSTDIPVWVPLDRNHPRYTNRGTRTLQVFGRLPAGASVSAAREDLDRVQAELARDFPDGNVYPNGDRFGAGVNTLIDETVGTSRRTLLIFLGAAGLLLLLSALNAANLFFVRGLDRLGEMSVRRALGAGRARLTREMLVESVALGIGGGLLGLVIALAGVRVFLAFAPESLPRLDEVVVNLRVVGVAFAVSVGSGILVGLLPALRLTGADLMTSIRERAAAVTRRGTRLREGLAAAQLALAVVLAIGASLLMHSFARVRAVDPGFDADGLVAFSLGVKRPGAPEGEAAWQAWDGLLGEVRSVPGVTGVAAGSNLPFQSPNWAPAVLLDGDDPRNPRSGVAGYVITPDFFRVAGIPVRAGRSISSGDLPTTRPVAVVNEAFVREHLGGRPAVGLTIRLGDGEPREIVGVVGDVVQTRAEDGWLPAVYVPHTQEVWPLVHVIARGADPGVAGQDLRRAAARFSPYVPVRGLGSVRARIESSHAEPRFHAMLIGGFALVAMLLAAVGLYGSLACSVRLRIPEIGVRLALGATPGSVLGLVVRRGMMVTVAGLAAGVAGAVATTRLIGAFLFGVEPLDPLSFGTALLLLLGAALLASLLPGRRAAGVDVLATLKSDAS